MPGRELCFTLAANSRRRRLLFASIMEEQGQSAFIMYVAVDGLRVREILMVSLTNELVFDRFRRAVKPAQHDRDSPLTPSLTRSRSLSRAPQSPTSLLVVAVHFGVTIRHEWIRQPHALIRTRESRISLVCPLSFGCTGTQKEMHDLP
ncbi:conserved hypothetical protein [Coccidioides posadasii str. Silveira]|uniref:Uncharacterized protein n=1 Tax=Coccidioides posadasii (strain RMSCC 757 / Silveira) TaxID=443226 RepID=E9D4Y7_COCPS|nr:conserved hypothetical protein [Coccidioides posadasii str. Silveira]